MSEETVDDFPLFPLGIVALPNEQVPLHIFEERYKTMFAVCLEQEREFGVVWVGEDGMHEVGCACEIEEVLETLEDGRMNVLTRGTRPFRILAQREDLPYPAGTVAFLGDDAEALDPEAGEDARTAYAQLVDEATDHEPDMEQIDGMDAYAMAATVDFGLDAKQGLLDLRSENARLRLVARLVRAALKRLDFADRVEARAKSNGKVRFG